MNGNSGNRRFPGYLGSERPAPHGPVVALKRRDPVDRLEQPRRPQSAQHRMNGFVTEQFFGPWTQLIRIAFVVLQPFFEDLMDRFTFPARGVVVVDGISHPKVENLLRIESERIRIEPIDCRDGNAVGTLCGRRRRLGPGHRLRWPRIVDRPHQPLQTDVARQATAHRIEPQKEARSNCRRSAVASCARNQHLGRSKSAGKVVRRKTDSEFESGHSQIRPHLGWKPGIRRRKCGPHTLVEPAENDEIRALEACLEQAPDKDPRMPPIGQPNRALVEQVAQHGNRGGRIHCHAHRGLTGLNFGEQLRRHSSGRAPPCCTLGKGLSCPNDAFDKCAQRLRLCEQSIDR
jgi:hypothetical protein